LIPAGTGSVMNRLRAVAAGRDRATLGTQRPAIAKPEMAAE